MTRPLRVGLIGGGWIAEYDHLPAFADSDRAAVVALAEPDETRRTELADAYQIDRQYADGQELLTDASLDAVSICTPPNVHEEYFIAAAQAGLHILCEKPLTTDAASARRMAEAATDRDIVTLMGYVLRYHENLERLRQLVTNDLLGDVQRVFSLHHAPPATASWYTDPETAGGGVVIDMLPHVLDFYFELFGDTPTVRTSNMKFRTLGTEDMADIQLDFDGSVVIISTGRNLERYLHDITVLGSNGYLRTDQTWMSGFVGKQSVSYKFGEPPTADMGNVGRIGVRRQKGQGRERITEFIDCALGEKTSSATVERGANIIELIDEIYDESDH